MKKLFRAGTLSVAAGAVALVLSSCSAGSTAATDTDDASTSSPTNSSALPNTSGEPTLTAIEENTGVEGAKALLAMWTSPPTSIGITEPVDGEIPSGKKIAFMNCGVEVCNANFEAVKEAAGILGWSVENVNVGGTPDEISGAWNRVAASKPDGVIATGVPSAVFKPALDQLAAAGIPVVECCVPNETDPGITAMIGDVNTDPIGRQFGAWIAADSNGEANVLWVGSADFPVIADLETAFRDSMDSWCPGCPIESIDIPVAEIGTTMPTKIAAYVRSNPDVNYIALGYDGFATGLPQALRDAGVADKVKFIGQNALPMNKQMVVDGEQGASIAFPIYEEMYAAVDALARTFVGVSVEPSLAMMPLYIYTSDNINDPSTFEPLVPDYQEQFKALWGK